MMLLKTYVLATVLFGCVIATDNFTCVVEVSNGSEEGEVLPDLPSQFSAGVVATITEKNYTLEIKEYYDYDQNRAASYSTKDGSLHTQLYDYVHNQVFDLYQNGTCATENFTDVGRRVTFGESEDGHVMKPSDFFKFGKEYNTSYVASTVVRGMPVDQWSACITSNYSSFRIDYFFAQAGYSSASGSQYKVPVRFELHGAHTRDNSTFHHIYDYVFFRPGPIENKCVFEIPVGYMCTDRVTNLTRKEFPNMFTAQIELINELHKTVDFHKHVFDHDGKLSRFDLTTSALSPKLQMYANDFGMHRPLTIIHDYNSGVEYVIDQHLYNCTARSLPLQHNTDGVVTDNHLVQMRNASQLFHMDQLEFHYQGERDFEELPCQVWTALKPDFPKPGNMSLMEIYYIKESWSLGTQTGSDPGIVGVSVSHKVQDKWVTFMKSSFVMSTYSKADIGQFSDVRFCYEKPLHLKHCVIKIIGNYDSVVAMNEHILSPIVRNTIAMAAEVELLRIMDLYFAATTNTEIDVWFSILDKPPVSGDAVGQIEAISVEQAYKNLKSKVKQPITIALGNQEFQVKSGYLQTDQDVMDPRPMTQVVNKHGYSPGSMAGLGLSMLVIGVVGGLGAAYLYVKRYSMAFPYVRELDT